MSRGTVAALLVLLFGLAACTSGSKSTSADRTAADQHTRKAPKEHSERPPEETADASGENHCDETGDGADCHRYALKLLTGDGVEKDVERAARLFATACDLQYVKACEPLAYLQFNGRGVERDLDASYENASKACGSGHLSACYLQAFFYKMGMVVEQDFRKAVKLATPACDDGHPGACVIVGKMLFRGLGGVDKDEKRAADLVQTACSNGDAEACYLTGWALLEGRGVQKDTDKAVEILERTCRYHPRACFQLAKEYREGDVLDKNEMRSRTFYRRACELGHGESCFETAVALQQGQSSREEMDLAAHYLEKSCELHYSGGCRLLAATRCQDKDECTNEDESMARRAVELEPRNPENLGVLADVLCRLGKPDEANDFFEKARKYAPEDSNESRTSSCDER